MSGILKFASTVILILLATALFLFVMCVWCGTVHAERKAIIQNGTLIVREVTETELLRIPSVPKELLAGQADSLVTGTLKKFFIRDEIGKKNSSFSFPLIKSRMAYADKKVFYLGGWIVQREPDRSTASYDDYLLSIFWLWIPAIFTVIASIMLSMLRTRKLRVFYIALLSAVSVSAVTGMFTGEEVGMLTGLVIGWWAVGLSIGSLRGPTTNSVRLLVGAVVGTPACLIAGIFAGEGNYKIVAYYLLFLIAVEIVSFVISQIVKVVYFAYIERKSRRTLLA